MRLSAGTVLGTPLIRIEGDVDPDDAPALQQAIWAAFGGGGTQIVLDLEARTHVSSTGLAVLFSVAHWVRAKQGRVIGFRPSPQILRLFQQVRLTDERTFLLLVDLESAPEMILFEQHRGDLSES